MIEGNVEKKTDFYVDIDSPKSFVCGLAKNCNILVLNINSRKEKNCVTLY